MVQVLGRIEVGVAYLSALQLSRVLVRFPVVGLTVCRRLPSPRETLPQRSHHLSKPKPVQTLKYNIPHKIHDGVRQRQLVVGSVERRQEIIRDVAAPNKAHEEKGAEQSYSVDKLESTASTSSLIKEPMYV